MTTNVTLRVHTRARTSLGRTCDADRSCRDRESQAAESCMCQAEAMCGISWGRLVERDSRFRRICELLHVLDKRSLVL